MPIETNKKDFENALEQMEETLEKLDHCVDDFLMNTLYYVITEYENHFKDDIENLIYENEDLKEKSSE